MKYTKRSPWPRRIKTGLKSAYFTASICSIVACSWFTLGPPTCLLNAQQSPQNFLYFNQDTATPIERILIDHAFAYVPFLDLCERDNQSFIAITKSYAPFLNTLDACRQNPSAFSPRIRNTVRFVDLAKQIPDELTQITVTNGFVNAALLYDEDKNKNPEAFNEKYGQWNQRPYDTLETGKGICIDYATLKSALLLAIKGDAWHKQNTSLVILSLTDNPQTTTPLQEADRSRHAVLLVTSESGRRVLDFYGRLSTEDTSVSAADRAYKYTYACENGDFYRDKLNHSERDPKTFQIDSIHYPDGSFTSFQKQLIHSIRKGLMAVVSPAQNPAFCSDSDPSLYGQTYLLLESQTRPAEEKKRLAEIKKLSIESNDLYLQQDVSTPKVPTGSYASPSLKKATPSS